MQVKTAQLQKNLDYNAKTIAVNHKFGRGQRGIRFSQRFITVIT